MLYGIPIYAVMVDNTGERGAYLVAYKMFQRLHGAKFTGNDANSESTASVSSTTTSSSSSSSSSCNGCHQSNGGGCCGHHWSCWAVTGLVLTAVFALGRYSRR